MSWNRPRCRQRGKVRAQDDFRLTFRVTVSLGLGL
jgi:hypothetical protein